jgi:uncharacterized lipoprotein YmbA
VALAASLVLSTLSATACLRRPTAPTTLYRLRGAPTVMPAQPSASVSGAATGAAGGEVVADDGPALTIAPYAAPGIYGGPQIVYRDGETRYGTYPNREWALPLGGMLAALTAETLRAEPSLASRVHDGMDTRAAGGLVWRGVVREFEEVDRGGRVFAAVRLDATLVHADTDSVLWSGSARAEQALGSTTDMTVVVDSLAALASRVVATLARDAGSVLRRRQ